MKIPPQFLPILILAFFSGAQLRASNLDVIGVTLLRATTTNLNGAGIRVAQPEAGYSSSEQYTNWEVNPGAAGKPVSLFTYISADGSTNHFPNFLSSESGHADSVAANFYGLPNGVATNVAHVDNFDANYFVQVSEVPTPLTTNYTVTLFASNNDSVVNQSFIFADSNGGSVPTNEQAAIDSAYDNFAAQHNVLFVSGAGNGSPPRVCPPATCYNGIGVGAYVAPVNYSSVGPTLDNGRCKPDLTAPSSVTSFSTPLVAGAAAILMQAGLRGDGGSDTNSAADIRTVKALLLNGAVKPMGWTNSNSSPLDARYGAGVLNVFNAYEQLAGGKQVNFVTQSVSVGLPHLPVFTTKSIPVLSGWSFSTNTSTVREGRDGNAYFDGLAHYFFNATNGANFSAGATLVWDRQQGQSDINNLDLFLYNAANNNLVACSTSLVDNVEHIFVPRLAPGRYDLQVLKHGGVNVVSASETYALAWTFYPEKLSTEKSGTNLILSWPLYPAGFEVQSATNLISPDWSANNLPPPIFTNNQNVIWLNATNAVQFFRLHQP